MKLMHGWTKARLRHAIEAHVPADGARGPKLAKDARRSCFYYVPATGARCAIGALLDDQRAADLAMSGAGGLCVQEALDAADWNELPFSVATAMTFQIVHDTAPDGQARAAVLAWIDENVDDDALASEGGAP